MLLFLPSDLFLHRIKVLYTNSNLGYSLTKDSISKERFVLDVLNGKSIFRTIEEKKSDSTFHATRRLSFTTTSFKDFLSVDKDLKSGNTHKFIHNFKNLFTIKIEEELNWKIEEETREILQMKTQKAKVNYGGGSGQHGLQMKFQFRTVYVFQSLLGLILEIYDDNNDYHFSLVQIKNSDGKLYDKDKALPISWKQYEKLALDYFSDPTREINGKNTGGSMQIIKWQDENGREFTPNFKEMNEREQKKFMKTIILLNLTTK
ncbi:hypothetical protein LDL59_16285 [Kaistella anthropi]|nr:hypothetical protein [Kaistella anthropi]